MTGIEETLFPRQTAEARYQAQRIEHYRWLSTLPWWRGVLYVVSGR